MRAINYVKNYFLCAALFCCALSQAAETSNFKLEQKLFVGTVYNLFHDEYATDEDFFRQVDIDIPKMKAANITHLLLFPMSQWDPTTKQLLWKRTDYLIKKIEQQGLHFVPLMLKEQQASHYFPIWAYKDTGLWDAHHQVGKERNTREDVDFADPAVYPYVEAYFKAVIERYGKSPALAFYNIWNEPHYSHKNQRVEAEYRQWLQKKYGNLAALRRAWGEDYSEWDQVSPFVNDDWDSSMPWIDWVMFRSQLNGQLLGKLKTTLRQFDSRRAINANPVNSPWTLFTEFDLFNTDSWQFTEHNDINGLSYYPDVWDRGNPNQTHPQWMHNFTFNTIRSASGPKNYVLTEMYTNAKTGLTLAGYLDQAEMNRTAWTAFANNAKGILFWKWEPFMRGRQSLGRGLLQVDGELAPRGEAVKAMGEVVAREGKALYLAQPKAAEVAIVFDMVGLLKNLEESTDRRPVNFTYESLAGTFKALDEANIAVDILRADLGISASTLKSYKAIILPFQLVMRRDLAALLKDYVAQGGHLIADARTATIDELDFGYRSSPGGLEEVFGADRKDWIGTTGYHIANDDQGKTLFEGRFYREQLRVRADSRILARFDDNGEPALIEHNYGKGVATLAATTLGGSYFTKPDSRANSVILQQLAKAKVTAPASFKTTQAIQPSLRLQVYGDKRFAYLINPTKEVIANSLIIERDGATKATEIIANKAISSVSSKGKTLELPFTLAPMGVAILKIE